MCEELKKSQFARNIVSLDNKSISEERIQQN